jgi:SWI/SNF chromatin-remodeling complex subunit SWI1
MPLKRTVNRQGGYDTRYLASIGLEIDNLRPDFPLPVDLGAIDLHAMSMSLQSMVAGEVRQALDKLVVLTADYRLFLKLDDAPLLLPSLSNVGLKLLESLKSHKISKLVHSLPTSESVEDALAKSDCATHLNDIEVIFRALVVANGDEKTATPLKIEISTGQFEQEPKEVPKFEQEKLDSIVNDFKDRTKRQASKELANGELPTTDGAKDTRGFGFKSYYDLVQESKDEYDELGKQTDESEFWVTATVNRLLTVTTILRNLSFMDGNRGTLVADRVTYRLLWSLIHELANDAGIIPQVRRRLDLIKDLVIVFSNVALNIVIENASDAFALLLFVLSFAPNSAQRFW